jgi:AcrR family transcriptional regulator
VKPRKLRKAQERTAVTRSLLLAAAERLFARVGYERAQVEEVAEAAGFSKGALYAHFESKEELFLALYEMKSAAFLARLRAALAGASTREEKIAAFRIFYVDLAKEKDWALISLEMKLFITRHPQVRDKLRQIDERHGDSMAASFSRVFGNSTRAARESLGGIFSALVLEAALEPEVFTDRKLRAILGTIFNALLGLSD